VDVANDSLIVEITGDEDKINSFVEVLRPFGILEMVRTGLVAMARGVIPALPALDGYDNAAHVPAVLMVRQATH
jgi:acetolactate synthase-1/3 small subunit